MVPSRILSLLFLTALAATAIATYCRKPPPIANGWYSGGRRHYPVGSRVRYYCRSGYRLQGWQYSTCVSHSRRYGRYRYPQWSHPAPRCIKFTVVDCGPPEKPEKGKVSTPHGTKRGASAWYRCFYGYELVGSEVRTCDISGKWKPKVPVCRRVCAPLPDPAFGAVVLTGRTVGSFATYFCDPGYDLIGDPVRECQKNGLWSGKAPTCEAVVTPPPDCPGLDDPANGQVTLSDGTNIGSEATYSCDGGFMLNGNETRTCQSNGEWSGDEPTCEPVVTPPADCPPLDDPANGQVSLSIGTNVGSVATYSCDEGFILNGNETRTCQFSVMFGAGWTGDEPTCEPIVTPPPVCPPLSDPANGQVTLSDGTNIGSEATYSCDDGFMLVGNAMRECEEVIEGVLADWSGSEPTCEPIVTPPPACPPLSDPANGQVALSDGINIGSEATYSCDDGFILVGNAMRECEEVIEGVLADWSGSEPTCEPIVTPPPVCPPLSDPANGQVALSDGINIGSEATYSCDDGFMLVGNAMRECEEVIEGVIADWSGSEPTCEPIVTPPPVCPPLSDPANGQVALSDGINIGSEATYSCDDGFMLVGNAMRECEEVIEGVIADWSGSEPTCEPIPPAECPGLDDPANGQVTLSLGTNIGSEATYSCDGGFALNGDETRTCQSNGEWSGDEPTCDPLCQDSVSARCDDNGENCLYTASWMIQGDFISFEVTATTTGWVGIGFSNDQFMPNSDVIVGAANSDGSFIHDRFAFMRAMPPIDASQDITNTAVSVSNGNVTMQFTRPRNSGDSNDISLDDCRFLLFAFSGGFDITDNTIMYHGPVNRMPSDEVFCFPSAQFCP